MGITSGRTIKPRRARKVPWSTAQLGSRKARSLYVCMYNIYYGETECISPWRKLTLSRTLRALRRSPILFQFQKSRRPSARCTCTKGTGPSCRHDRLSSPSTKSFDRNDWAERRQEIEFFSSLFFTRCFFFFFSFSRLFFYVDGDKTCSFISRYHTGDDCVK